MLQVNEYFDGQVKSIGFANQEGHATVGVMAPGSYEFGTNTVEIMQILSGAARVQLTGEANWQTYQAGSKFTVAAKSQFRLEIAVETAYLCRYE
jgi:uncharacterized protein YaiE (UPF0345 family)